MPAIADSKLTSIPMRQRLIIEHLLAQAHDTSVHEVARKVGASVRTLRRDLPDIERLLRRYRISLKKKPGAGILLVGSTEARDQLRQDLPGSHVAQLPPSNRQAWLACALLASAEPVKLHALADSLGVTMTTVSGDLEALEGWFSSHGLTLQRRRGWGVSVAGAETDQRRAIIDQFFAQFDEFALLALFRSEPPAPEPSAAERLLQPAWMLLSPSHCRAASALVQDVERSESLVLDPIDRVELSLHIALILARGARRRFSQPLVSAPAHSDFVDRLRERLGPRLRALLPVPVPPAEFERLGLLILGIVEPVSVPDLSACIQGFLQSCDQQLGVRTNADPLLREGLTSHLGRTLQRLRSGWGIRNPALAQIKENYAQAFSVVRQAAAQAFPDTPLPETEVGLLTLHVGSALERLRHRRWRALVVCSAGVGTARMLSSRLGTELPEVDVINILPARDVATIDPASYDIVLSTIPLEIPSDRYLVVSPLLLENNVRAIKSRLSADGPRYFSRE